MKTRIAIIGAGPSGLASVKAALERGMVPVVFEKAETLGGVWRPDGLAWPTMQVNISRHTGAFSDFPWKEDKPDFPTTTDMYEYLVCYAKHFDLERYIKFNCRVIQVSQQGSGWNVRTVEKGTESEEYFDVVIVAGGRYGTPHYPAINGVADFPGEKLHSSEYRGQSFNDKTVLIVGGSTSGTAIADEAAHSARQVIHLVRRPRWIVPRTVPAEPFSQDQKLPHDMIKTRARQLQISANIQQFYDYYTNLCKDQNNIPAWTMNAADRFGVVVADDYLNKVKEGKIIPIKDEITRFDHSTVVFKSGKKEKIDSVIFCTGFHLDLSYFDPNIVKQFQLEMPHYSFYKHTIHPDFPTLAFIAITYRDLGAVFPTAELQAVLACEQFSGRLNLSPPAMLKKEISADKPIGDGLQLQDALATRLHMMPDFMTAAATDPDLFHALWEGTAIPAQYRLTQGESERQQACECIIKTEKRRQQLLASTPSDIKNDYANAGLFGQSQYDKNKLTHSILPQKHGVTPRSF